LCGVLLEHTGCGAKNCTACTSAHTPQLQLGGACIQSANHMPTLLMCSGMSLQNWAIIGHAGGCVRWDLQTGVNCPVAPAAPPRTKRTATSPTSIGNYFCFFHSVLYYILQLCKKPVRPNISFGVRCVHSKSTLQEPVNRGSNLLNTAPFALIPRADGGEFFAA
jgi:hypothetical protein